jgi:hypothetical protein
MAIIKVLNGKVSSSTDFDLTVGTTDVVTIEDGGNVGIGTTNPNTQFDIYTATDTSFLTQFKIGQNPTTGYGSAMFFKASGNALVDRYGVKIGAVRSPANNGAGEFVIELEKSALTGITEVFRIDDEGNVGVGTTVPSQKLHTFGTSDTYALLGSSHASADIFHGFENTGDGNNS